MLSDPITISDMSGGLLLTATGALDYLGDLGHALAAPEVVLRQLQGEPVVRKGLLGDGVTTVALKVNHSLSKENAPFVTNRSVVRFDFQKVNATSGRLVTASGYFVSAHPLSGDFTAEEMRDNAFMLALFILQGGLSGGAHPRHYDALPGDTLSRIIAGEG
jgi:hypothetical protein